MPAGRIVRWDRGVDTSRFDPSLRDPRCWPAAAPRTTRSTSCTRAASPARRAPSCSPTRSCARARASPACTSCSPAAAPSRSACASASASTPRSSAGSSGAELARAYASADMFLFPSATDTFGQVILEAQASGLPVVAVAEGGPLSLIEHRVSGLLCDRPIPTRWQGRVLELAGSPLLRERLTVAAARLGAPAAPGSARCSDWPRGTGGCSRRRGAVTFTTPRSRARREPFRARRGMRRVAGVSRPGVAASLTLRVRGPRALDGSACETALIPATLYVHANAGSGSSNSRARPAARAQAPIGS